MIKGDFMVKKEKVTIKDVARVAGVSPSTVSRVISDSPRISIQTKKRVNEHMKELGYHPNAVARNLARNKTSTIGLIMPDRPGEAFQNPFFPEALRGIMKSSVAEGYDVLLSASDGSHLKAVRDLVASSKVDGILLMTSRIDDESVKYLREIDFPFSVIGSPSPDGDDSNHVDNDNEMAAWELTSYMVEIGCLRLALITGEKNLTVTEQRIRGFKRALEEKNTGVDYMLYTGEFHEETGYRFGKEIVDSGKMIDGVIATDDVVAYGVISAFTEKGIRVPEDVMVAGFNNSLLSRQCNIPITTVEIHAHRLGEEAVSVVIERIRTGKTQLRRRVPHTIFKRESTKK